MSDELDRKIDALLGEMRDVNRRLDDASTTDGGRKAAALDGQAAIAAQASKVDEAREDEARKDAKAAKLEAQIENLTRLMHEDRGPSKAASIGNGAPVIGSGSRLKTGAFVKAHPALAASFENYQGGEFMVAYAARKGYLSDGLDPEVQMWGKAQLSQFAAWAGQADLSRSYSFLDAVGKATLGTTGATGGYVLPNNLVDTVIKPKTQRALYTQGGLVTVINGVAVRGVDQPYRTGAPARATFADWGVAKENVNETYGSYTATLGTLAKIYDVGKQYLRFSAGAAEQDVMDELTKSFALGENYAVIAGPGTGAATPGVNDPTLGVYTALLTGVATYRTAHGSAASNTLLGSLAFALTEGAGALGARNRESQAWVVDATTFWTAIGQGTNEAGFFVNPAGGPTGFARTASGELTFWNQPVYYDSNLGTNATTKIAIGGEWDAVKFYRGMEFRIDSSDVAGTRWDNNIVGFRGEEEIAINASSAVSVGAMQLITAVIA